MTTQTKAARPPLDTPPQTTLSDAEILELAGQVLVRQATERAETVKLLVRRFCPRRRDEAHHLGKPMKLTVEESLLLFALERNGYRVESEAPNRTSWYGDATCRHHAQDGAIAMRCPDRLTLLWSLWESVSDQAGDRPRPGQETGYSVRSPVRPEVTLTENDLYGAVRQRHLRELQQELKTQEAQQTQEDQERGIDTPT